MLQFAKVFLVCLILSFSSIFLFAETLTWKDCVKFAKENNPTLKISEEKVKQAEVSIELTKKNMYPNLDANASASGNKNDDISSAVGLSYRQKIFDNKQNLLKVQSLEKNLMATRSQFFETSVKIRYELRVAFIDLFYAQEALKVAESIEKIRKSNYELVQMNFASGLENKGAVLLSEAQLLDAKTLVKNARLTIEKKQQELAVLIDRMDSSDFRVSSSFEVKESSEVPENFEDILATNPSLKTLELLKESERLNLELDSLKFLPSLSFSASLNQTQTGGSSSKSDLSHSYGVSVSVPIFAGNILPEKIKSTKSAYEQIALTIKSTRNALANSLKQKWLDYQISLDEINTQAKFLEAYQSRSEITRAKYSIGLVSFDDWTIIEDNLINVKKVFLQTEVAALKKEADLVQAKGGSLDYD